MSTKKIPAQIIVNCDRCGKLIESERDCARVKYACNHEHYGDDITYDFCRPCTADIFDTLNWKPNAKTGEKTT